MSSRKSLAVAAGSSALLLIAVYVLTYFYKAVVAQDYLYIVVDGAVGFVLLMVAFVPYLPTTDLSDLAGIISSVTGQNPKTVLGEMENIQQFLTELDTLLGQYPQLLELILSLLAKYMSPEQLNEWLEHVEKQKSLASGSKKASVSTDK